MILKIKSKYAARTALPQSGTSYFEQYLRTPENFFSALRDGFRRFFFGLFRLFSFVSGGKGGSFSDIFSFWRKRDKLKWKGQGCDEMDLVPK